MAADDIDAIHARIVKAERLVAEAIQRVADQEDLVAKLRADGLDLQMAEELLALYRKSLATFRTCRTAFALELEQLTRPSPDD
jgi:hypothetical protein